MHANHAQLTCGKAHKCRITAWHYLVATTIIFATQDGSHIWRGLMTSLPLYPFAIGFLPYLFVRSMPDQAHQPTMVASWSWCTFGHANMPVFGFFQFGLVQFHAIFANHLMVMALSVPFLGKIVGWRRWVVVGCGFAGVLVILHPSSSAFGSNAVIPLCAF